MYLDKTALQAVKSFELTSENYNATWKLLNDRYGNEQLVISCHMNNLIKLETITHPNVKDLRNLYDSIESNVRALSSLGIDYKHFGSLLIPIILEKLPNTIRLQISRKLGKENQDIEKFLKTINQEIIARESYEFLKQSNIDKNEENNRFTTTSFYQWDQLQQGFPDLPDTCNQQLSMVDQTISRRARYSFVGFVL